MLSGYNFASCPLQGGARPGAGRKRYDPAQRTHRLGCAIPPPLWKALKERETKTGLYPTQIVRAILTDALIGGVVTHSRIPDA